MRTVEPIAELRTIINGWKRAGDRIAFVPTMGNLHSGHMSLIERGKALGDRLVASIYVNPLQFGLNEDYEQYPRTLEVDQRLLTEAGVDLLFTPTTKGMYPLGEERVTKVDVPELSTILCGEFRPGHFVGVATVVSKLLNLVQPDVAVFGEKDYQQLTIIRRVVADLCFPVEIVGAPTGREPDGLAMSSRNRYLTAEERKIAPKIFATLKRAAEAIINDTSDFTAIERDGAEALRAAGFDPDYFSIRLANDLSPASREDSDLVILTAARLGNARLIDNVRVRLNHG